MKYLGDYHTHTKYSDGLATVEQNVQLAISKGLQQIAITDHGFNNPASWSLSRHSFAKQSLVIADLRKKYADKITVFQGIEADIIGLDGTLDIEMAELPLFDVLVMGYHTYARAKSFVDFRKLYLNAYLRVLKMPSQEVINRNTKAIINSLKKYPIDILAHPNHLLKVDCYRVAQAAADYGTYIELNAKHIDTLSHDVFEKMLSTDVKFIMSSDCHNRKSIGDFSMPEEYIKQHSFNLDRIENLNRLPTFKKK